MPLTLPRTVREAWGEEAATDFADWFELILEERTVSRDEFRQILSRLDILERDVSDLKTEVRDLRREMNERFDRMYIEMNGRFERLQAEMNERFDRMNERFDRMNERFDQMYERMLSMTRWTIGTLALFGTIITILLAVGQFAR